MAFGPYSVEQSAFLKDRQIQDNIFIVQEVIHKLRVRRRWHNFQAILKLDMQKAYDRVEWDFLCDYMLKLGFNVKWVSWIKDCILSVSFSILVNGEPSAIFRPTWGIRQGNPLSPYLFIIMANVLSTLMGKAISDGSIRGIRLNPTYPTLSHLLFADDAIFFLNGTIEEAQNVANVLNQYCYVSGQAINLNKSGLFTGRDCP